MISYKSLKGIKKIVFLNGSNHAILTAITEEKNKLIANSLWDNCLAKAAVDIQTSMRFFMKK